MCNIYGLKILCHAIKKQSYYWEKKKKEEKLKKHPPPCIDTGAHLQVYICMPSSPMIYLYKVRQGFGVW